MNLKLGVKIDGVRGFILTALGRIESAMEETGEYTVTSLLDGKHGPNSFHYVGYAADLRTRHMKDREDVERLAAILGITLGPDYEVIVEKDHIHVEPSAIWVANYGDPRKVI